ncbi:hypothetical protein HK098_008173 [Nowakowskiella sp. JEL0407]|nr:hypothetical protein HK098_008173 [Nowakowskiella sp. JEL0407]
MEKAEPIIAKPIIDPPSKVTTLKRQGTHRRAISLSVSFQHKPPSINLQNTGSSIIDSPRLSPTSPSIDDTSPLDSPSAGRNSPILSPNRHAAFEFGDDIVDSVPETISGPLPICLSPTSPTSISNLPPFPPRRNSNFNPDHLTSPMNPMILHKTLINSCVSLEYLHNLLHHGAIEFINYPDTHGRTPLHISSKMGSILLTRLLLTHGADPSIARNDQKTPLHIAASIPSFEMCALLLAYRADVTALDSNSRTPLLEAVETGHYETVKLLLDTCFNLPNSHLLASLQIAGVRGTSKIFKILLDRLNDVINKDVVHASAYGGDVEIAQMVVKKFPPHLFPEMIFATEIALQRGNVSFAKILVESGFPLSFPSTSGLKKTPIHWLSEYIDTHQLSDDKINEIAKFVCSCESFDFNLEDEDEDIAGDSLWILFVKHYNLDFCKKAATTMIKAGYCPQAPVSGLEHYIITQEDDIKFLWVSKGKNSLTDALPSEILNKVRSWVYANDITSPYTFDSSP